MRDLLLLIALVAIAPMIWRAPVVGILAWIWVTLMNPQREVYGFLRAGDVNLWIVVLTAFAWLVSKERKTVPLTPMALLLVAFGVWTSLTTAFAIDPAYSQDLWLRTIKTLVLALAVMMLVNTRSRMQAVIWTYVAALGYFAVKGGGFVLITGGRQHVFGPANTMIEDNNALALALIMILPLANYLRETTRLSYARLAMGGLLLLAGLAIFGTYSRGALLALVAGLAVFAVRSRVGVAVALVGAVMALSLPAVVPQGWLNRMQTIQSYNDDASFTGRVKAWKTAINIAEQRPLTGGGFSATNLDSVAQAYHTPGSLDVGKAAHSIYFEVLGDHGVIGLALYLAIVAAAWVNTSLVLTASRDRPDLAWANRLARMLQVSIVAYLVGGAALSMAYYDGFLVLLALTACLLQIVRSPVGENASARSAPRWKRVAIEAPAAALPNHARAGLLGSGPQGEGVRS